MGIEIRAEVDQKDVDKLKGIIKRKPYVSYIAKLVALLAALIIHSIGLLTLVVIFWVIHYILFGASQVTISNVVSAIIAYFVTQKVTATYHSINEALGLEDVE